MDYNKGCFGCKNAQWDADGCTCNIDGLLVGDVVRGCAERGELLKLKKEHQEVTTITVQITRERLLYCFKADTTEEFERRIEQLARDIQLKIERELFRALYKKAE